MATWNEGFEFRITHHERLFGVCQADLYDAQWLLPDRHVGRAEIRLRALETFPDVFTSYFELWEKRLSGLEVNLPGLKPKIIGAVQLTIRFNHEVAGAGESLQRSMSLPQSMENVNADIHEDEKAVQDSFFEKLSEELGHDASTLVRHESHAKRTSSSVSEPGTKRPSASDMPRQERSSLLGFIGNLTLAPETQHALKAISKIATLFGQGFEIGNVDILAGTALLDEFYKRLERYNIGDSERCVMCRKRRGTPLEDLAEVERVVHFYKFAFASYGWRGLNFAGKGNGILRDSMRRRSDELSIREYLVLQEQDLISFDIHGTEIFKPSYYVARDRLTDSIVVAIRGTMSAVDTLTDLVCDYHTWRGGLVHAGVKASATGLFLDVIPKIIAQCHKDRIANLIIVGHSLGAGTASVLTMILHDIQADLVQNGICLNIHAYAFGPPCVVSLDIAERYRDCITSVVLNEDVICRLSYGSMMDLRSMLLASAKLVDSNLKELLAFGGIQAAKAKEEEWKERIRILSSLRDRLRAGNAHRYPKLYIPGSIYHVYAIKENSEEGTEQPSADETPASVPPKKVMQADICHPDDFVEVQLVSHMLLDHLPSAYDKALTRLRQSMMLGHRMVPLEQVLSNKASPSNSLDLRRTNTRGSTSDALLDKQLPPLPER